MTPGARIQAAIECLDSIFSGEPAEKALTNWARRSRFAGSKDRAAVRDHVFDALRSRDSFATRGGALTGRGVMIGLADGQGMDLGALFNAQGHSPAVLSDAERAQLGGAGPAGDPQSVGETSHTLSSQADSTVDVAENLPNAASNADWNMPHWCAELLRDQYGQDGLAIARSLTSRAPLDLRVNLRRGSVTDAIGSLGAEDISAYDLEQPRGALRVTSNARRVKLSEAYLAGLVEVQDRGSQALVQELPLSDGMRVLDFCAGGGGKSLAIASLCDTTLFAHDVSPARMKDIPTRAARAGAQITCVTSDQLAELSVFDLVLCDAPCSGSGAWRRNPDAKWVFSPSRLDELLTVQSGILEKAADMVMNGGVLAYATCSLFACENENQVNAFLQKRPDFTAVKHNSWTPRDDCDGFFVSVLQKEV